METYNDEMELLDDVTGPAARFSLHDYPGEERSLASLYQSLMHSSSKCSGLYLPS